MMKKIYKISIIVLILAIVLSLVSCTNFTVKANKGEVKDYSDEVLNNLAIISSTYANRTAGSEAEKVFVEYISNYMSNLGYVVDKQEITLVSANANSYNIECKKIVDDSKKNILIGCQYDNCYELLNKRPDGAYESGVAIASLMEVSKIISTLDLNYNVTIVYFGGGVQSWSGAEIYADKYSKDVDLMINYSMLGGGDKIYMYSRDVDVNYNKVFYEVANVNNLGFTKVPQYKRVFDSMISENSIYNYTHVGMFGNHYAFMNKSIPSIAYFAMNWESQKAAAFTEIEGKENVFETNEDTYANMLKRVDSNTLKNNINGVINSTIITLKDNTAVLNETLDNPDEVPSWLLGKPAQFFGGIVVRLLIVTLLIILANYAKNYIMNNREKYVPYMQDIQSSGQEKEENIDPFDYSSDKDKKDDKNNDDFDVFQ